MCAVAGISIIPDKTEHSEDGDEMDLSNYDSSSALDYQDLFVKEGDLEDSLRFEEHDQWPVTSSGYPLKERYLQLLCGSEHSESEQYQNVIDHWSPSDEGTMDVDIQDVVKVLQVMPQRKRGFEQLDRDGHSTSDRSRPMTEIVRSKKRWDSQLGVFGVVCGAGERGG